MTQPDTRNFYDRAFLPPAAEGSEVAAARDQNPQRPARRGANAGSVLTMEQIRNIVFKETQSLSGPDVWAARFAMAASIMNADARWGDRRWRHAGTMKPNLPQRLDARQRKILGEVEAVVNAAVQFRTMPFGADPAGGATNFNMRPSPDDGPPRDWGANFKLQQRFGPLPDALGGEKYIYIWQNPDAEEQRR